MLLLVGVGLWLLTPTILNYNKGVSIMEIFGVFGYLVYLCCVIGLIIFLVFALRDSMQKASKEKTITAKFVDIKKVDGCGLTYYVPMIEYTFDGATYHEEYHSIHLSEEESKTFNKESVYIWVDTENPKHYRRPRPYGDGLFAGACLGLFLGLGIGLLFFLLSFMSPNPIGCYMVHSCKDSADTAITVAEEEVDLETISKTLIETLKN